MAKKMKETAEVRENGVAEDVTETTDVALTTSAPLPAEAASYSTDLDSFYANEEAESVADNDGYIPTLRIAQKDKVAGMLVCKDLDMAWDEKELVLLKVSESGALWDEDFKMGAWPLCRSLDGKNPACDIPLDPEDPEAGNKAPMAKNCATCEYAKWHMVTEKGKRKKEPPQCTLYKDLWVLDIESSIVFLLPLSGISLSPYTQQLKKPLKFRKMALSIDRKRLGLSPAHISMFKFKLTIDFDERDAGSAYKAHFAEIEELTEDEKTFTGLVAMQMKNVTRERVKDDFSEDNDGGEGNNEAEDDDDFS